MTKQVTVEELRSELDSILGEVEEGTPVDVVRDGRTVATIKPTIRIVQHGTPYPFRDFDPGPLPKNRDFDAVQWLIDEDDPWLPGARQRR